MPVTPGWVVPSALVVDDAYWIAHGAYLDHRHEGGAGIAAAIAWVQGMRNGPITGRDEQPVTAQLARAEMWAATAAEKIVSVPPPVRHYCAELGVAYWPVPDDIGQPWAVAVRSILRWLSGATGQKPPVETPIRHPDGRTVTAEDLYEAELGRVPGLYRLPEQRRDLRHKMDKAAARSRVLARAIDATRAQVQAVS